MMSARQCRWVGHTTWGILLGLICLTNASSARAQFNNIGGIQIDTEGVVSPAPSTRRSATLDRQRREAFLNEHLPEPLQSYTDHRVVSLVALERAYLEAAEAGEPIPEIVMHLGGLQRIDYLFVSPERGDVAIAGPAEAFVPDETGRMVGVTTGRPALRLDDLIVALRTHARGESTLGCSIDHDPQRLADLQRFNQQNSGAASAAAVAQRYQQMARILGMQHVSVWGAPPESHFARVLVEADYRMKRIAIGLEPSGVRGLSSYLSMLALNGNSLQRWWFTPYYEAVHASKDGLAFQLEGQRVQLLAQEEISDSRGNRQDAPFTRRSTERFAQQFTEHYPELADRSAVFAELQNLFDLGVVAALIRRHRLAERAGWDMAGFLDPPRGTLPEFQVPRYVPSEATSRRVGGYLLGLVGGVTLSTDPVISHLSRDATAQQRIEALQGMTFPQNLPANAAINATWWWDPGVE